MKAMIEITRRCNLRCPACPIGTDRAARYGHMDFGVYQDVVSTVAPYVRQLSLFNYGEPLLHPRVADCVSLAKAAGIPRVIIHSNGQMLSEEISRDLIGAGLSELVVSVDANSESSYQVYRRGGSFERVVDNVRRFRALLDESPCDTKLFVQFVVMRHNEAELQPFKERMRALGVSEIKIKLFNAGMALDPDEVRRELVPVSGLYSRYRGGDIGKAGLGDEYDVRRCSWPRKSIVVNANGEIVACCYDYNGYESLGEFARSGKVSDWWDTSERRSFIARKGSRGQKPRTCANCHWGTMNA